MKTNQNQEAENGFESKEENDQQSIYAYIYLSTKIQYLFYSRKFIPVSNYPQLKLVLKYCYIHDLFYFDVTQVTIYTPVK